VRPARMRTRALHGTAVVREKISNPHLAALESDYLYHLGITNADARRLYGDVKFVCCGGSAQRMQAFAESLAETLGVAPYGCGPAPLGKSDRFTWFKVGPVLVSSHGMGQPSFSILLHEVTKLLHYAGAEDVTYFRLGSSGGIGVEPGTVVVTTEAMDGEIKPQYTLPILGRPVSRPTQIDATLVADIVASAGRLPDAAGTPVVTGRTMSADCFYEGQGRLDGALCDYTEADKFEFLDRLHAAGVRNIEMEAGQFASFMQSLGLRGAVVCVTLLNRLEGDQVLTPLDTLAEFDARPGRLVQHYIAEKLAA